MTMFCYIGRFVVVPTHNGFDNNQFLDAHEAIISIHIIMGKYL